MNKCIKATNRQ